MRKIALLACGIVAAIVAIASVVFGVLYFMQHRKFTSADFGFIDEVSKTDFDGDGIEDYADIVEGARECIATKPEYESKYYPDTGYPDDNKGVCTDVIWSALKAAGYDLRGMMAKDIKSARDIYEIKEPNENIDFRRVRNINIFLRRHAKQLGTDLDDPGSFQYGDIVIFGKYEHIGILSDMRNKDGLPYLIHHGLTHGAIEEDALANMELKAHYRFEYR